MCINTRSHNTSRSTFGIPIHPLTFYFRIIFVIEIKILLSISCSSPTLPPFTTEISTPEILRLKSNPSLVLYFKYESSYWLNFVVTRSYGFTKNGTSMPYWNTVCCSTSHPNKLLMRAKVTNFPIDICWLHLSLCSTIPTVNLCYIQHVFYSSIMSARMIKHKDEINTVMKRLKDYGASIKF